MNINISKAILPAILDNKKKLGNLGLIIEILVWIYQFWKFFFKIHLQIYKYSGKFSGI